MFEIEVPSRLRQAGKNNYAQDNNRQLSRTGRPAILRPNIVPTCGALHKTQLNGHWIASSLCSPARALRDDTAPDVASLNRATGYPSSTRAQRSNPSSTPAPKDGSFAALTMTRQIPLRTRTREHHNLICTTQSPLSRRSRTHSRHTSPHRRRNSNLSASMHGRASVQFLPAYKSYG